MLLLSSVKVPTMMDSKNLVMRVMKAMKVKQRPMKAMKAWKEKSQMKMKKKNKDEKKEDEEMQKRKALNSGFACITRKRPAQLTLLLTI